MKYYWKIYTKELHCPRQTNKNSEIEKSNPRLPDKENWIILLERIVFEETDTGIRREKLWSLNQRVDVWIAFVRTLLGVRRAEELKDCVGHQAEIQDSPQVHNTFLTTRLFYVVFPKLFKGLFVVKQSFFFFF